MKINSFANCMLPNGLLLSTKGRKVHPCDFKDCDDDGKIFNVGLKVTRCFLTTSEIIGGMPDVCR